MVQSHSQSASTAYHDLRRLAEDQAVAGIIGNPHKIMRNGRGYWYDMYRLGTSVKNRYLGEDSPKMVDRITRHKELAAQSGQRLAERNRLARLLRAEGHTPTDRTTGALLAALARVGVFRLGGTIVGTPAFRLYEGELGVRLSASDLAQTGDIDIASFEQLSLALGDKVEEAMNTAFQSLDFKAVPSLSATAVWQWHQSALGTLVKFLTASFRPEEDIRPLPALGVAAQSLHFLDYLIADPIKAVALYRSGVLVQIPRPEAYAIHKPIVANRRQGGADALKSRKDRALAALLIQVLAEDRPDELREAYHDALSRGPSWQDHIARSLKRMPDTAALRASLG